MGKTLQITGIIFVALTVLFLMALVLLSVDGLQVPASSKFILHAILALTAAISAGAIGGHATINFEWNAPFKVGINAVGGIAVFFGTLYLTSVFDPQTGGEAPKVTAAEERVRDLHHKVDQLQTDWIQLDRVQGSLSNVAQHAPQYASDLEGISSAGLNLGHQIDQQEYAGFAYLMAGDAALHENDKPASQQDADKSIVDLKKTLDLIGSVQTQINQNSPNQAYLGQLQTQIENCMDVERCHYLLAVAYALEAQLSGNPTEFNKEAVAEYAKLSKSQIEALNVDPKDERYLGTLLK